MEVIPPQAVITKNDDFKAVKFLDDFFHDPRTRIDAACYPP
jgi:hypothetical protein